MKFDLLSAFSLIYVFVFAYGSTIESKIEQFEQMIVPGNTNDKGYLNKKYGLLWMICFPYLLLNIGVVYVSLPVAVDILQGSKLSPWNFDVNNTMYCLIIVLAIINVFRAVSNMLKVAKL